MSVCSALCDVWSLGSVVAKGSRKPLTEDDLPEPSPIFALGAIEGTPAKIDARAAALRAADPDLKTPLVLKFVLAERRPLVVVACILGGCHGLINSCGRFIVLRLAIDAVLDEKSYQTRLIIGCLLVGIISAEGFLLAFTKHLLSDHVSHFMAGRMATLLLSKVTRVGKRPEGKEETKMVGADLPGLLEQIRIVAFLPSGIAGLLGGLSVLIVYLGLSGVAGLFVLVICMVLNRNLGMATKRCDAAVESARDERLGTMKQVIDGIKAIKFYAWEES